MVPNLPQPMAFEGSAGKQSCNLGGGPILRLGIMFVCLFQGWWCIPCLRNRIRIQCGLGLFWHPAFCPERLGLRHFGTTDILACVPFGHANISTHGHLVLWTFRYGNISALRMSWHKYFYIDSSSEMFLQCYLTIMVVPTIDISAKRSTYLKV